MLALIVLMAMDTVFTDADGAYTFGDFSIFNILSILVLTGGCIVALRDVYDRLGPTDEKVFAEIRDRDHEEVLQLKNNQKYTLAQCLEHLEENNVLATEMAEILVRKHRKDEAVIPVFRQLIRSTSATGGIMSHVMPTVHEWAEPQDVEALVQTLFRNEDPYLFPQVAPCLLPLLDRYGDECKGLLLHLLKHPDWTPEAQLINALGRCGDQEALEPLRQIRSQHKDLKKLVNQALEAIEARLSNLEGGLSLNTPNMTGGLSLPEEPSLTPSDPADYHEPSY